MVRSVAASILLMISSVTFAAWDIGGGLEEYRWQEYTPSYSSNLKEYGMRSALFVNWAQERQRGALLAWRAKLYGGNVKYDTFLISNGAPITTRTEYGGVSNEVQLAYRNNLDTYKADFLGGIGMDIWRRTIGGWQIEDYSILFMRAGLRLGKARNVFGWHGECGIKYPITTRENAHLTSMDSQDGFRFTTNPILSPKGAASGYAEIGYRINSKFDAVGYYDSWRFRRSADVIATDAAGTPWIVNQPKSYMDALGIKLLVSF